MRRILNLLLVLGIVIASVPSAVALGVPAPTPEAAGYTFSASPNPVEAESIVNISWSKAAGDAYGFIGLYNSDTAGPFGYLDFRYPTAGVNSGTVSFTAPSTAGTYWVGWVSQDDGLLRGLTSFIVQPIPTQFPGYSVVPTPNPVSAGNGLTVTWTKPSGAPTGFVGIYSSNTAQPNNFLKSLNPVTSGATGTVTFVAPTTPGDYWVGWVSQSDGRFKTLAPFTVQPAVLIVNVPGYSVAPNANPVTAGSTLSVAWAKPVGSGNGFVAIYDLSAPDAGAFLYYSSPAPDINSGTVTFVAPTTVGDYWIGWVSLTDGQIKTLTSVAVQPVSSSGNSSYALVANPDLVNAGTALTVSWFKPAGAPTGFIGIYDSETSGSYSYVDFTYPAANDDSGTVSFIAPNTVGSYWVGWVSAADGQIKTLTPFSVQPASTIVNIPGYTLVPSPNPVSAGATFTVAWGKLAGTATGIIGIYNTSTPQGGGYLDYTYPSASGNSGVVSFVAPLTIGNYWIGWVSQSDGKIKNLTPFTVQPVSNNAPGYSLVPSPNPVDTGSGFTVTWVKPAGAGGGLIGIYNTGTPLGGGYQDYNYPSPTGLTGTVTFIAPTVAGNYWVGWVSQDDGQIKSLVPFMVQTVSVNVPGYSLVPSPNPVSTGAQLTVAWVKPAGAGDGLIGLYNTSNTQGGGYLDYAYPSAGGTSGTVSFTAPATAGTYWVGWVSQVDGKIKNLTPFTIQPAVVVVYSYTVVPSPNPVGAGTALTVAWTKSAGAPTGTIGIYNSSNPSPLSYVDYASPSASGTSGTVSFIAPIAGGNYWVGWVSEVDGLLKTLTPFSVQAGPANVPGYALVPTPNPVTVGAVLTVTWTKPEGAAGGFIGIYDSGSPGGFGYLDFLYPSSGNTGTVAFVAPTVAGNYWVGWVSSADGQIKFLTPFAVQPVSGYNYALVPSPSPVLAGATLSVAWTKSAGAPTGTIGIYNSATPVPLSYLSYTTPSAGNSGTVTLVAPAVAGDYWVGWVSADDNQIKTLTPLTVQAVFTNTPGYALVPSPNPVTVGAGLTVTWTKPAGATTGFIGIYNSASPGGFGYLDFTYPSANGDTGTVAFVAPLSAGSYWVGWVSVSDGQIKVLTPFTVQSASTNVPGYLLVPSANPVTAGSAFSVAWTKPADAGNGLVGIYDTGTPQGGGYLDYTYPSVSGLTGTVSFVAPTTIGSYWVGWVSQDDGKIKTLTPFTVQAVDSSSYTLVPSPNPVSAGATLSVAWNKSAGAAIGVIGIYNSATPLPLSYLSHTSPVTGNSGAVTLVAPTVAGNYWVGWVSSSDGQIKVLTPFTVQAVFANTPGYELVPNPNPVTVGGGFTVAWTKPAGAVTGFIGIYDSGSPGGFGYLDFTYPSASGDTGTVSFVAPTVAGNYWVGWVSSADGQLKTLTPFAVQPVSTTSYTLVPSPNPVSAGATLTVAWTRSAGAPNGTIGIYNSGTPAALSYLSHTTPSASGNSGTVTFVAPTAGGNYWVGWVSDDDGQIKTLAPFSVQAAFANVPGYTLTPTPTPVSAGGTLTVAWTKPAGAANGLIGIYNTGTPQGGGYLDYTYGSASANNGNVAFVAPTTVGNYWVGWVSQEDGQIKALTPFTVQAVFTNVPGYAATPTPNPVGAGGVLTVSWVKPAGAANGLIGIYDSSTPQAGSYLDYTYPSASGNSGTVTFVAPTTVGTYWVGWVSSADGQLKTLTPFSVQAVFTNVPGYLLTPTPNPVSVGSAFTVTWVRPAGSASGFIGIYNSAAPGGFGYLDFTYPSASGTTGTVTFIASTTVGNYWVGWVSQADGQLKTLTPFTVQPESNNVSGYALVPSINPVSPAGALNVTWTKPAGAANGLIGIYNSSTPQGGGYLDYSYGSASGTTGTVAFVAPTAAGDYWLGWLSLDDGKFKSLVPFSVKRRAKPIGDFDNDGKVDVAVYRPSTGEWRLRLSSQAYVPGAGNSNFNWGGSGDIPVMGDFDGDGKTDIAIFRPSTGEWYLRLSTQEYVIGAGNSYFVWGGVGDQPLSGDFDGDAKTDIAIYRPSTGEWYLRLSTQDYVIGAGNSYFQWGAAGDVPIVADFDGDLKTDIAIYRPSTGEWYLRLSTQGYVQGAGSSYFQWGATGDQPLNGDFDGDGQTDIAIYRPSTGEWYLRLSAQGYVTGAGTSYFQWGANGDQPLSGDFDGDGKTDIAIYRPSTEEWYLRLSTQGFVIGAGNSYFQWGEFGDTPLTKRAVPPVKTRVTPFADFDGDGKVDIAVYRPSTGNWYSRLSSQGYVPGAGDSNFQWGISEDIPVMGDFDGDLKTDIAVYRPSTGEWLLRLSTQGYVIAAGNWYFQWGLAGDLPLSGDFDGDGKTDITVYRPSTGNWYSRLSSQGYVPGAGDSNFQWGISGDIPVMGDFDGDLKTDIAVYRPSTGEWLLRLSTQGYVIAAGNWYFQWGAGGDQPITGDFDGDDKTDIAVYRPSTGEWFLRLSTQGYVIGAGNSYFQLGAVGDQSIVGDFDGDGKADITVYRPSTGEWFLRLSTQGYSPNAGNSYFQWGIAGDLPFPR